MPTNAATRVTTTAPCTRGRSPLLAHQAVSVSAPTSRNVFSRCPAIHHARAVETSSATSSSSTSPAPISASRTISTPDATAARRTMCPGGKRRQAPTTSATTSSSATPLVSRWPSSISVSMLGDRGTTSPLQRGQWLPQPAPEPVARTNAPQRITPRFAASVAHAKVA